MEPGAGSFSADALLIVHSLPRKLPQAMRGMNMENIYELTEHVEQFMVSG